MTCLFHPWLVEFFLMSCSKLFKILCTLNKLSVFLNSLKSQESLKQHLNPLKLLYNLENVMSNDSIIVADGGDFIGTAAYILR